MHKIEISGVVHQNLSGIFNLCNAEGNHKIKHSQIDSKVPKFQLTLTLGRLGRERERGKSRDGTLVHGEGAGEDDRPRRGLRRPEERRLMAAAAAPREEGLEQR
jgi:hypothetical protein